MLTEIDIESLPSFSLGFERSEKKGVEEGLEKGVERDMEKGKAQVVRRLLSRLWCGGGLRAARPLGGRRATHGSGGRRRRFSAREALMRDGPDTGRRARIASRKFEDHPWDQVINSLLVKV